MVYAECKNDLGETIGGSWEGMTEDLCAGRWDVHTCELVKMYIENRWMHCDSLGNLLQVCTCMEPAGTMITSAHSMRKGFVMRLQ